MVGVTAIRTGFRATILKVGWATMDPVMGRRLARFASAIIALVVGATVLVTQPTALGAPTAVTISVSDTTITEGGTVTASGIAPGNLRRTVMLQRKTGDTWRTITRGTTGSTGRYRLRVTLSRVGEYRLRVRAPRAGVRRAAGSRAVIVSVRSRSDLGTDTLATGRAMLPGQFITSSNGRYRLIMQADGNLVMYDGWTALWATYSIGPGRRAVMQSDGNFVIYHGYDGVWSTSTTGFRSSQLVIENNGNLVLYSDGLPTWSRFSGYGGHTLSPGQQIQNNAVRVSPNLRYRLVMQTDGNLVLYDHGAAVWSTATNGPDRRAVMQADGNFVIYHGYEAVWNTQTGLPGSRLVVQDDGNIVVYKDSTALWSRFGLGGHPATYPWSGAKCQWTETVTTSCTNYDWYWDENGDGHFTGGSCDGQSRSGECFDQWGYQYRNCTSYVAWRLAAAGRTGFAYHGNAKNWASYGTRVSTPAPGDVAVFPSGTFGHVAYVESVDGGTVTISDFNKGGTGEYWGPHAMGVGYGAPIYIRFP